MDFLETMLLAVGLSMDAFAVSVCKGLSMKKAGAGAMLCCGAWFGGFQALMPLIGFFLGSLFADAIAVIDHWVAFTLLTLIGINMIRDAFCGDDSDERCSDLSVRTMSVLALATSIDALAVGISLAMAQDVQIFPTVGLIGLTTFGLSAVGVRVGSVFGDRYEKRAQIAGGLILIGLGCKILLEHLGGIG